MRAARVEVIGPNKRTAPLESGTGPQDYCKLMTETILSLQFLFFFKTTDESKHSHSEVHYPS